MQAQDQPEEPSVSEYSDVYDTVSPPVVSDNTIVVDTALVESPVVKQDDTYADILSDSKYDYLQKVESDLKEYDMVQPEEEIDPTSFFNGVSIAKNLFLGIAAVIILLIVIYYLFFSKNAFIKFRTTRLADQDDEEGKTEHVPFDLLLEKAMKDKEYQLALRYVYLMALEHLARTENLILGEQKSNHQYISELKNKTIKTAFAEIVYHFEVGWYGHFPVDAEKVHLARKKFNEIVTTKMK